MSYPPSPWRLRGQLVVSLWWVPRDALPPLPPALARVASPVLVAGRGLVGTAWVDYQPGGDLHYRELLCAVLVRHRARLRISITGIWVDSPPSREGGRRLWGIPKDLAALTFAPSTTGVLAQAETADGPIAQTQIRIGGRLPGRWPARWSVTQLRDDQVVSTPVRARASIARARAGWRVPAAGPLSFLHDRRPWCTLALRDFRLVFGR